MLFTRADLDRVATGEITVAFRRWRRPTVRAGGTLTTRAGVLAIEAVERIKPAAITDRDARRAGRASGAEVAAELDRRSEGETYRIAFRLAGPDPRIRLRDDDDLSGDDVVALRARLARLDDRSPHGPWTAAVLDLIDGNPGVRAADLAERLGRERDDLKTDVRKLKALGLTESLLVGYRLSPRGRALRTAGLSDPS